MRVPSEYKRFLAALMITASVSVCAQVTPTACDDPQSAVRETIAELRDVQGNVLVSDAQGMASGTDSQRLKNRARVTTTSRAGVTVAFDCGCVVRLKENERLDLEAPRTCAALLAAVQGVPTGAPIGAVATGGAGLAGQGTTAVVVGSVGVGAYLLYRNNRNVSPN